MGFFTRWNREADLRTYLRSQSLSGWDGVFHKSNPFVVVATVSGRSQSLSGWDGVFHRYSYRLVGVEEARRNPFQGGMGFFTIALVNFSAGDSFVAIPFRVGWGFSHGRG